MCLVAEMSSIVEGIWALRFCNPYSCEKADLISTRVQAWTPRHFRRRAEIVQRPVRVDYRKKNAQNLLFGSNSSFNWALNQSHVRDSSEQAPLQKPLP